MSETAETPDAPENARDKHARLKSKAISGGVKHRDKLAEQNKLPVRQRLELLLDPDSFVEDGLYANVLAEDLPADGVVTGVGRIGGRPVCVMANDPTVKAGSWGSRTVEKIIRIQERAARLLIPMLYLVDSAGARITDQVEMFPGRRHAGRIFHNEVGLSGRVPQVCLLFGPSAAGGAYIPAFCDVVAMVEGNASMYLGSPRMAQVVVGEKVTLEEMGGARMHATVSGCGDFLVQDDAEAIALLKEYIAYMPQSFREEPAMSGGQEPVAGAAPIDETIPEQANQGYDMRKVIAALVDAGSFLEVKKLYAKELITGFGRLGGRPVGIVANQPMQKGGVLFVDSADKAARFINLCNAYGIPLVYLMDVPGFMVGTKVEQAGIIRHGAKMLYATANATVPKVTVVLRKAYGAGYYVMCGRAYEPDLIVAWPSAEISVMGAEGAVEIIFRKQVQEAEDPAAKRQELIDEFRKIIDVYVAAGNDMIDDVIDPRETRATICRGLEMAAGKRVARPWKRSGVVPV